MSDELFTVSVSMPPRLFVARKRAEAAERAYAEAVEADEEFDGFGIVPDMIMRELKDARLELARAEEEELRSHK